MKKLLTATVLVALVFIIACKKTPLAPSSKSSGLDLSGVRALLKDSLQTATFDSLDFSRTVIATRDTGKTYLVRVPLKGVPVTRRFFLVRTNGSMIPQLAMGLEIQRFTFATDSASNPYSFSGSIKKTWLNGTMVYTSAVNGGFIEALHSKEVTIMEADEPYVELPEIIIYAPDQDYYADWDAILDDGGGAGGIGYSSSAPTSTLGSGSAGAAAVNSASFDVATELQASRPAINLKSYLACFDPIVDPGATYTATLCVRIPNPGNPNIMWNPLTGNVGHTFIELSKTSEATTITQYLGFYAACGICAVTGNLVNSKMVDNQGHPYDAKLTVSLTSEQFTTLTNQMVSNSELDYALGLYNCTNYAVNALNMVLPTPINVPDMTIPGQDPGMTPNGLYKALATLPVSGPDGNVAIYSGDQTAGTSHGPCN